MLDEYGNNICFKTLFLTFIINSPGMMRDNAGAEILGDSEDREDRDMMLDQVL